MGALSSIKVLDFSMGHDASAGTMYMADHGAEVIKIEDTSIGGDVARSWEPMKNGKSAYFELLNRGKKSVALDFTKSETQSKILDLVKTVDVVVENLPIDQLEKMGLGYEKMKEVNPKLIYAKVSPFGLTGPMRNYPGTEYTTFAFGGYLQVTGYEEQQPTIAGYPIMGYSIAHFMLASVGAALIARNKTGMGQLIDLSMADISMSMMEDRYASFQHEKLNSIRCGNAHPTITPYDTVPCKDGFVNISPSTQQMWVDFCRVLEFPEITYIEEYENVELRQYAYFKGDLKERIVKSLAKYTKVEATKLLNDVGIPASPVCTIAEAYHSEQLRIKEAVTHKQDAVLGEYAVPSVLGIMNGTPADVTQAAPEIGADNKNYLSV